MNIDIETLKDYIQNILGNSKQNREKEYQKLYEYLFGTPSIENEKKQKIKEIVEREIKDVDHLTTRAEELKNLVTAANSPASNKDNFNNYYNLETERQILLNKLLDVYEWVDNKNLKKVEKLIKQLVNPEISIDRLEEIRQQVNLIIEAEELENDIEEDDYYINNCISDYNGLKPDFNNQEQIDAFQRQLQLLGRIDYATNTLDENMNDGLFSPKNQIMKQQENIYLANVMCLIDIVSELPEQEQEEFYNLLDATNINTLNAPEENIVALLKLNENIYLAKDIKAGNIKDRQVLDLYNKIKSNKPTLKSNKSDTKHYSKDDLIDIRGEIAKKIQELLVDNAAKLSAPNLTDSQKNDLLREKNILSSDGTKILDDNIKESDLINLAQKYKVSLIKKTQPSKEQTTEKLIDKIKREVNTLINKDNLTEEEKKKLSKYQDMLELYKNLKEQIKTFILEQEDYDFLKEEDIINKINNIFNQDDIQENLKVFANYKEELTKDLKAELISELKPKTKKKQVEISKNRKDILKKSLYLLAGGALGVGLSFLSTPSTTTGLIISGTRLAYSATKKIIKIYTKNHVGEDTKINRFISKKDNFIKKHPLLNKCNNFFKDPRVQLFLNGVAMGYVAGKIGQSMFSNNPISHRTNIDDNLKDLNQNSLDANKATMEKAKLSKAAETLKPSHQSTGASTLANADTSNVIDMSIYEKGFDGSNLSPYGSADAASALRGETIHLNTNYAGKGSKIIKYVDEAGKKFNSWKDVLAYDSDAYNNLDDYAALVRSGADGGYEDFAYKTVEQIVKARTK